MVVGPGMLRSGERWKTCPRCGHLGIRSPDPTRTNFYPARRHPDGTVKEWISACRPCKNAESAAYRRRRRRTENIKRSSSQLEADRRYREAKAQDPEWIAAERARRAAHRAENPERCRQIARDSYYRIKANPERYAAYLERKRIAAALRQEKRTGRLPTRARREPERAFVDVEPLKRFLHDQELRDPEEQPSVIAERIGVTGAHLDKWYKKGRRSVSVEVVDRVFMHTGFAHLMEDYYPDIRGDARPPVCSVG